MKSATGLFKGKLVLLSFTQIVEPKDEKQLSLKEEIELQTVLGQSAFQFKINQKDLTAHFDLGTIAVGAHWYNPYLAIRMPRTTTVSNWLLSTTLGSVFHFNPATRAYWLRFHSDLSVIPALDGKNLTDRPEIEVRQNLTVGWRNFIFGVAESWKFRNGFSRAARLSVSIKEAKFNGYAELEVKDHLDFTHITLGGSYAATKDARVYAQVSENICNKKIDLAAGVDATIARDFGVKLGYFHQKKIASVLSFKLNKYFSGSLLFDVTYG